MKTEKPEKNEWQAAWDEAADPLLKDLAVGKRRFLLAFTAVWGAGVMIVALLLVATRLG